MNLVSTILLLLAPAISRRIASSLGLGEGLVSKAISAAIPVILAALASRASKPGGANQLSNVLAQQDPGLLGNLGSLIGGAGQQSLIEGGNQRAHLTARRALDQRHRRRARQICGAQ